MMTAGVVKERTREGFVIHIDEWQWVSPSQVKRLLRDWGYRQLPLLEAEPASTRDQERKGHAPVPHSDSEASESPARLSVEAEAPGERPPALNRRGRRARRTRSKRKPEVQVANALDEVLCTDDLEADPPLRRSKATFLSEGLDKLRQQLGHKDSAQERKRSQDTATALAEKAASAAAKKPPAKKPRTSGLAASLRKALKREETATDEEAGDEGEEADEDSEIFAGLHSRRQKLRTLAKLQPGKLLVAGMQNFAEQLGQAFGEASDDPLRPLAVRYLLSVVAPTYPGQTLSDSDYRELRSLAEMLDQLVRGETATLGDFLMQRFKAKLMATRDASWSAAKYLELIPIDPIHHGTTVEEEEWVRNLRIREAKLDEDRPDPSLSRPSHASRVRQPGSSQEHKAEEDLQVTVSKFPRVRPPPPARRQRNEQGQELNDTRRQVTYAQGTKTANGPGRLGQSHNPGKEHRQPGQLALPAPAGTEAPAGRMSAWKKETPRKQGESRRNWKKRVFQQHLQGGKSREDSPLSVDMDDL
ncbi:unnamed protein product [Symbiodinium natans]|uniref:Uncharacterized protein n=1 Tax=Symbiodinium natans TaxID=878477 RepID=A0A812I9K1_9DINO|nr:unnamed protein product [Symbiodinium natans]